MFFKPHFFKSIFFISLILLLMHATSAFGATVGDTLPAINDSPDWNTFSKNVDAINQAEENSGLAYMISGAAVAIGGGIINNQSTDPLTNLTLSLIQSAGIAGIGYGAGLYSLRSPDDLFRDTLQMQTDLTPDQRISMTKNYLSLKRDQEKKKRIISAITYGLVAAFNTYNAIQSSNGDLKTVYWAVAGVNLAMSLSFTF